MISDILCCEEWREHHDRPVYTLQSQCPECHGPTTNSAPPPFSAVDRYGEYRRALKESKQE